jgi:hypothetical protein
MTTDQLLFHADVSFAKAQFGGVSRAVHPRKDREYWRARLDAMIDILADEWELTSSEARAEIEARFKSRSNDRNLRLADMPLPEHQRLVSERRA